MNKAVDPIGQNLKAKRKERGLSVPELSDLIGIPADRIYKWEANKATPKYEDRQFLEKWIGSEDWKNVPRIPLNSQDQETIADLESRRSLERTLENLSEDKIRSTAIIERLVALLEDKLSSRKQPVAEGAQNDLKVSVAEAEQELARTGRSGPFSFPKEAGKEDKKGKTNK